MTNALSFESASDLAGQALENPFMNFLNYNLPTGWSYTFNKNAVIADNTCPAK